MCACGVPAVCLRCACACACAGRKLLVLAGRHRRPSMRFVLFCLLIKSDLLLTHVARVGGLEHACQQAIVRARMPASHRQSGHASKPLSEYHRSVSLAVRVW
jgi:hypothetical protein